MHYNEEDNKYGETYCTMYDEWKPGDATVDDDPTPYWTLRRILLMLVILITLIAFLLYTFSPLITSVLERFQPEPEPLSIPLQRAQIDQTIF